MRQQKTPESSKQDETGFRTAITGAFQTYALSLAHRRDLGHDMLGGKERALRRDQAFGDHH